MAAPNQGVKFFGIMQRLLTPLAAIGLSLRWAYGASLTSKEIENEKEPHPIFAVDCSARGRASDVRDFGIRWGRSEHKFFNHHGPAAWVGPAVSAPMPDSLPQVPPRGAHSGPKTRLCEKVSTLLEALHALRSRGLNGAMCQQAHRLIFYAFNPGGQSRQ